jgi:hypothetical protein
MQRFIFREERRACRYPVLETSQVVAKTNALHYMYIQRHRRRVSLALWTKLKLWWLPALDCQATWRTTQVCCPQLAFLIQNPAVQLGAGLKQLARLCRLCLATAVDSKRGQSGGLMPC